MVSTKSTKYTTYHERALAAIVGLHAHKKKFIHPNTLRTQVHKNASLRNDKLGPAANKWILKGIQKLHDMGITEPPTSPNGSFTLTPKARKRISEAQTELGISWEPTPRDMEDISRIVHKNQGSKRRASTCADESPTKRARTSRTSSRLTKSQLSEKLKSREAEIESLRTELESAKKSEQHVHPMLRGLSPLSAPASEYGDEDDVVQTLQPDVDDDEDEDAESTQMDVDIPSSPTVVPSIILTGTAPSRPGITPLSLPRTKSLRGLTATQSGSFIDNLSKQPTPAPSSPGGSDYGDAEDFMSTMGDHEHEDVFNPPTPRVRVRSSPRQFEGGLATPQHTPRAGQSQQSLAPSQEIIDRSTELLKDLQRQEQENVDKITTLTTQLDQTQAELSIANGNLLVKDARVTTLEGQVLDLQSQQTRLLASEATLLRRQAELVAGSADVEARLLESTAMCDDLQASLNQKTAEVVRLETENQVKEAELGRLHHEITNLKTLVETRSTELGIVQHELDQAKEALESTRSQLTDLETHHAELSHQLSSSTEEVALKTQELTTAEQRIAELILELENKTLELEEIRSEALGTQRNLSEMEEVHQSILSSLQSQLVEYKANEATLRASLLASETRSRTLEDEFISQTAEHASETSRLSTQLDQTTRAREELEGKLKELVKELKEMEEEFDELREKKRRDEEMIRMQKKVIMDKTRMMKEMVKEMEEVDERMGGESQSETVETTMTRRVRRADRFSL